MPDATPCKGVCRPPPLTEGTNLVDRSRLLDPFVDADDIEWKDNLFERAEQENKESPDELLAMIQFEGSPRLQEKLMVLCRVKLCFMKLCEGMKQFMTLMCH